MSVVCCQIEASATGRSRVITECVCVCVCVFVCVCGRACVIGNLTEKAEVHYGLL